MPISIMNIDTLISIAEAIIAVVVLINCGLALVNVRRAKVVAKKVDKIEVQTNGINQKLIDATAKGEFARGLKQGEQNGVKPHRAKRKPAKKTKK